MLVDKVISGLDSPTSVPVTAPPVQPAGGVLLLPNLKLFPENADVTMIVSFPPIHGVLSAIVLPGTVTV